MQVVAEELRSFDEAKAKWINYILCSRWNFDGNKCTKLSFKSFRELSKATNLSAAFDEDGNLHTGWDEMAATTVNHFTKLLGETQGEFPEEMRQIIEAHIVKIL